MKTFLSACLAITGGLTSALAQSAPPSPSPAAPAAAASASPSPVADAELEYVKKFGAVVLETLYSGEYAAAADEMNPDPPLWKGSKAELHKARCGDLNTMFQNRAAYGLRLSMECTRVARVSRPKRPATEQFFEVAYKSTYGDKLTAMDLLTIIKKDGKFYVERFR
ncbi:hypothetical protein BH09VER1_BH09VER1_51420 [soil metagenome]